MMKFLNKKRKVLGNKGFSLVELIIVIAIMAVLMAVLAPQLIKYVEKSRVQADETAAAEILNAVNVAITQDAIYTNLVDGDTLVWDAVAGTIVDTSTNATLDTEVKTVINPVPIAKSQAHKAATLDTYTVTIDITNGIISSTGAWGAGA